MKMKKKWIVVLVASIAIILALGSVVTTLVLSSAKATNTNANTANGATGSGTIVIAWNKELLHIVQTPGAQPTTIHPTRSFAILHAAIYDAVVSITRDAPAYLFSVSAPSGTRADAAAAEAGHDTLVALYPGWKAALDQQLASELTAIPMERANSRASRSVRPSPCACSLCVPMTVPPSRPKPLCRANSREITS